MRQFPAAEYRAIGALALAAVAAKKHEIAESHHPTLRLAGPMLTWKSWTAEACAIMAGADLSRAVIHLPSERGGSLTRRRDARGAVIFEREALSQPIVVIEERDKASAPARQAAAAYTYGSLKLSSENENLRVGCVAIVTSNIRAKSADVLERFEVTQAEARRSIMMDTSKVMIPDEVLLTGDKRLDVIRALGPIKIPAPTDPHFNASAMMHSIIVKLLAQREIVALIDFTMLELLARGMTSFLPPDIAAVYTLRCILKIYATLGWLKADWQERFEELAGQDHQKEIPPSTAPAPRAGELVVNGFDYNETPSAGRAMGLSGRECGRNA